MTDRTLPHPLAWLVVCLFTVPGVSADASHPSSGSGGLTVPIDVRPWQADNVLPLDQGRSVHVALLSTPGLHTPREVARYSLTFGRAGDEPSLRRCLWLARDVNGDGLADLVCAFAIDASGFVPGDTVGVLQGRTRDGVPFAGRDQIRTDPPASVGLDPPDIGAEVAVEVSPVCRGAVSHRVRARWSVSDFETPPRVTVTAVQFDGMTQHRRRVAGAPGRGQSVFPLRARDGGPLYVLLEARSSNGTTTASTAVSLPPCDPEPPPDPGEGFTAPPSPPPEPPIGIPGGRLREVEVVHLGGSPDGPNAPRLVSAVGTGGSVQMTSWTLAGGTLQPMALKDSPILVGHDVKLHALSPLVSPKLAVAPFVSGLLRDDVLWLTTWQLAADGTFLPVHTLGYGGDVAVRAFDIAHRPLSVSGHDTFQLVTPVLVDTAELRMVTWSVDAGTGQITGLQDSGKVPANPSLATQLDVQRLDGAPDVDYVVAYKSSGGDLATQLWEVIPSGFPFLRGGGVSGLDIRGTNPVTEPGREFNVLPLAGNGFLSVRVSVSDSLPSVWDYRMPGFEPLFAPYRIADESLDQAPDDFGIDVGPPPQLTNGSDPKVQNGAVQNVRALLTDVLWEETFGPTAGEVVRVVPPNEPTSIGIASITKVMTLLLTIDALNAHNVDLDDQVTASAKAAGTGGTSMNLTEGETHTLRSLLYGMMLVSGNDAAVAIAEHVAGSDATFVSWMNLKAQVLGLSDTSYNQPAAGGYSTPEDQMNLFRFGWNEPLFREFTTQREWKACGTLKGGAPVCRDLVKSSSDYPGLQGWKTGGLGFTDPNMPNVPLCTACLVSQTTRADRTFIAMIQQSGSRWGDTRNLYDYGFTRLFTPDFRGDSGYSGGPVEDFALDAVTDRVAVTAALDAGDQFEICAWSVSADTGSVQKGRCNGRSFLLAPSGTIPARQLLDSARLSNLLVEGDYLTARGGQGSVLVLDLWRVAPKEP